MACSSVRTATMLYITLCCTLTASAATVQVSLDKAANAVGGVISERQLESHKMSSRMTGPRDCVHKYMSNLSPAEQPLDPCFFDMGAGIALHSPSGRKLLQATDISAIPNYAASAGTPRGPLVGLSPGANRNPSAGSPPHVPGTASPQNQNPFAAAQGSPIQSISSTAPSTPANDGGGGGGATTVNGGGGVIHDKPEKKTGLPPPVPQPIGPNPLEWQQTEDFPEGTRLTIDQADLLLSGRGFH